MGTSNQTPNTQNTAKAETSTISPQEYKSAFPRALIHQQKKYLQAFFTNVVRSMKITGLTNYLEKRRSTKKKLFIKDLFVLGRSGELNSMNRLVNQNE